MKKLFLQAGKLWYNELPEQNISWELGNMTALEYDGAVSAAMASAVEVVDGEEAIDFVGGKLMIFGQECEEGQLCSVPEGWTVEIKEQYWTGSALSKGSRLPDWMDIPDGNDPLYRIGETRKIARLIPLKEQSSGIAAVGVAEYGPLAEEYIGTWMIKENDIPQVHRQLDKILGVLEYGKGWEGEKLDLLQHQATIAAPNTITPESGETEGFEWLIKTNSLITDASNTLFEDNGVVEEGICLMTHYGDIALTVSELKRIIKQVSVSPPPQAESQEEQDDMWAEVFAVTLRNGLNEGIVKCMERFAITRKAKP